MTEAGGTAAQAGIFYQNSVAALALADLLDFDRRIPRERVSEVRVEAPDDVDDVVIRFADGHREFQNVKLSVQTGNSAWSGLWRSLSAQFRSTAFRSNDHLTLVVEERSNDSEAVAALCERAASSIDEGELRGRLTRAQLSALESISRVLDSQTEAFELLRRTSVRHLPLAEIERELARRRLAGGQAPPPSLLPILRDIAGGDARRRGIFQSGPLRRRLKLDYGVLLREPPEWGLEAYRDTIKRLSRIEVPGMGVVGPTADLFVWPRARNYDRTRPTGFEDEILPLNQSDDDVGHDLRSFPNDQLDRVIVVAGPGYGKSALLTAIRGALADGPLVPVLLPLASLAAADGSIISFLTENVSREMDLSPDWQQLAEQGLLVLLLDGLDEVPSVTRPTLMDRISTFSARYPRAPWVLTVRDPAVVTGLSEATLVELLPLIDADIERFAEAMRRYIGDVDGWEFVRRLKLYPDLYRLARIPLFLAMLLATSDLKNPEPLTRSDLIEAYLKTLFSPAQHKPVQNRGNHSGTLRKIAETLAFERLEKQEIGATEREVREIVSRISDSTAQLEVLFEQMKANGILKPQSAIRLQFPYPIVQEYLAACHLIERYPDSLEQRIDDAIMRPWAQVIQFALELHPAPEPIIRAMLARRDDAFCTGLRLVGHCIANGAAVSADLREDVGDRLVAYWTHAPSQSRERVGRLLADGFSSPPSARLKSALHHRWLIVHGAGDIISRLNDVNLTLSVLESLMENDRSKMMIYHSLKPALSAAGDAAFRAIAAKMDPDTLGDDDLIAVSSLLSNFAAGAVSRDLALSVARNERFPAQVRMQAYEIAGSPLEKEGIALVLMALRHDDWDRHYGASDLIKLHFAPASFLEHLLRDCSISCKRRKQLAGDVARILPDASVRGIFLETWSNDSSLDEEIRLTLKLYEARFGDRTVFEQLVEAIAQIPVKYAATTISLFGHFPDRALADRASMLARDRELSAEEVVSFASSVSTGMRYIFEMDFGFGGLVRPAPPHPGLPAWLELLEDWAERQDLSPRDRLHVLVAAVDLGSQRAYAKLETTVHAIDDMDAPEWTDGDELGHTVSHALYVMQRREPLLSRALIDKIVASENFNVAARGVDALQSHGDIDALRRLIHLHSTKSDWGIRDTIANAIELMAARQSLVIQKIGPRYQLEN